MDGTELVVTASPERSLSVAEIVSHVQLIQHVLADVMKPGVHYGKPFVGRRNEEEEAQPASSAVAAERKKNVLLKAGAEVLCMTFRIAPQLEVEELPERGGGIRYRVKSRGVHQVTGQVLGEGMGEASTAEEKFQWRRAICAEEFDAAPATERRIRYRHGKQGSFYTEQQVREQPADKANTVLKMAVKRAEVAMTLIVTACSDMFAQDLEEEDDPAGAGGQKERKTPQRKAKPGAPTPPPAQPPPATPPPTPAEARARAKDVVLKKFEELKLPIEPALQACAVKDFAQLTSDEFHRLGEYIERVERERAAAAAAATAAATF